MKINVAELTSNENKRWRLTEKKILFVFERFFLYSKNLESRMLDLKKFRTYLLVQTTPMKIMKSF